MASPYRPLKVKTLLVGEGPPPNGKTHFYKVPEKYNPTINIELDKSLPATIFNHYFGRRPHNAGEYQVFLNSLRMNGIFLMDMYKKPEKFRGDNQSHEKLFSESNISDLLKEISAISPEEIIFLLARSYSKRHLDILRKEFPNASLVRWKKFRMEVIDTVL